MTTLALNDEEVVMGYQVLDRAIERSFDTRSLS